MTKITPVQRILFIVSVTFIMGVLAVKCTEPKEEPKKVEVEVVESTSSTTTLEDAECIESSSSTIVDTDSMYE